jgi:uncharacterized protein YecT (DUF1311 family)
MPPSLLFALATLIVSTAAHSGGYQCKYDGHQQEMIACAVRDYHAADKALNAIYKEVMSSLPPAKKEALRREQREWLKARDPTCKKVASKSEGGSVWPTEYYGCLQTATELRTKAIAARKDTN